jgi:hypothetical protein
MVGKVADNLKMAAVDGSLDGLFEVANIAAVFDEILDYVEMPMLGGDFQRAGAVKPVTSADDGSDRGQVVSFRSNCQAVAQSQIVPFVRCGGSPGCHRQRDHGRGDQHDEFALPRATVAFLPVASARARQTL